VRCCGARRSTTPALGRGPSPSLNTLAAQAASGLRCLYAAHNSLTTLAEPAVAALGALCSLDVSHNALNSLSGVSSLPALATLQAAGNKLSSVASLAPLAGAQALATLDVTDNGLELGEGDADALIQLLACLPSLRVLYLAAGNPAAVAALGRPGGGGYRRTILAALPSLAYLDDRPVFDAERRAVDAWARGGTAAEREAAQAEAVRAADGRGRNSRPC